MAISDNAFQADQNENMDIVEVDVDPFASAAADPTSEIVSENDEFEINADNEEVEFTSSSDISSENEFEGRDNPEDRDVEDSDRHLEETSTTGRGTLSHHATPTYPDGRYSLHYTYGWSHVTRPYPTYAPGPSSSHYTSSSPPGHPYPYQHDTPSPPVHTLPPQHAFIPSSSHHSTPSPPADVYPHDHGIRPSSSHHATPSPSGHLAHSPGVGDEHISTSRRPQAPHRHSSARSSSSSALIWDLPMSFAIYDAWCRRAAIRYTGNIYLIAKKRITPIYLTKEVFEHYKRMRATDEAFKKKSEQMSSNRKSKAELTRRLEKMSTQTPDTSIEEDVVYLEVVPEVKGRVYDLGSQGYHRNISSGGASSSRGPAYGLHELEKLQQDHQRPRVPPIPRTPPSPGIERSGGPHSNEHPGHLTTEITPSQSAHPHDHRSGYWTSPHRRMSKDQRHLLDDHDEFMEQLMPPPRPPPQQE
ncbi:hypothetical protein Syun_001590 [Stephania yunnanensis]|uniref:Uncharacterized protein n=1 Tax=Stephania yunnanensis TaxID=152371 RepID=A0AAP0Q6L5_9MAGN